MRPQPSSVSPSKPEEAGRAPHRTSGGHGPMTLCSWTSGPQDHQRRENKFLLFYALKKKKSSLSYRGSKNINPKSLLHLFFAGLERTPFCSGYIIFLNHKVPRTCETFLNAIQDGSSENHLGQKNSTRLEGKVIVLCSQHISPDFTYEQQNFRAAFSQVVTPAPIPISTLIKKYNTNFYLT